MDANGYSTLCVNNALHTVLLNMSVQRVLKPGGWLVSAFIPPPQSTGVEELNPVYKELQRQHTIVKNDNCLFPGEKIKYLMIWGTPTLPILGFTKKDE